MSHNFSVAIGFWPTKSSEKWSFIIETTGPECIVVPSPQVPSSAVTTHATRFQFVPDLYFMSWGLQNIHHLHQAPLSAVFWDWGLDLLLLL